MTSSYLKTIAALESSLQCRLVASPLGPVQAILPLGTSNERILEAAQAGNFSQVPLREPDSNGRAVVTHVALIHPTLASLEEIRAIALDDLISGETPLSRLIQLFGDRRFFFVLESDRIQAIVTWADLNRLPVRTYLHTLLDHLEALMAETINDLYREEAWVPLLSEERQRAVTTLFADKRSEDFDTRLIDCTTLSDKATVIAKAQDLRQQLGTGSRKQFDKSFKCIRKLRGRIDHGLEVLARGVDDLRDNLAHASPLASRNDLTTLQSSVRIVREWIDALTPTDDDPVAGETDSTSTRAIPETQP